MTNQTAELEDLRAVIEAGADYGKSDVGRGRRVLVEFVSAQPNTVLTVTHGRGGVVGDVIATLFAATGYEAQREFYVNDANESRPLRAFARAVLALYRQRCGLSDRTPETDGYSSDYVLRVAERIYEDVGDIYAGYSTSEAIPVFLRLALDRTQSDQREILSSLQIRFDNWSLESELSSRGSVAETLDALEKSDGAYWKGGALWLRSSEFGDSHDHVLRRADGTATYLAGDLAYHRGKFERGHTRLIDVWSADHASYVTRTRAGIAAMGFNPDDLDIVVFQRVRVLKDGTELRGSSDNSQSAVSLTELIEPIGADETRFCLALSDPSELLDINIDMYEGPTASGSGRVKHAIRKSLSLAAARESKKTVGHHGALDHNQERGAHIAERVKQFPSVVAEALTGLAPQKIADYALQMTKDIEDSISDSSATPDLYRAAAITLENSLVLLGVSPGSGRIETNL